MHGHHVSEGDGSETEAHEHPIALAKWNRERWVGSCRREILDHVIALDERHLLRLIRDYASYYHQDRIHDSLEKDTPNKRAIEPKPAVTANVTSCRDSVACTTVYTWHKAA